MPTIPESVHHLILSGIDPADARALRRISMTLHRWHELACGTGEGQTSISVERDGDEPDSKPFLRVQYPIPGGYVDRREPTADREAGAKARLAKIMARYPSWTAYVQPDPRGCALYILRPGDVPAGSVSLECYTRGIAVYR